jgi:hypothetical protein
MRTRVSKAALGTNRSACTPTALRRTWHTRAHMHMHTLNGAAPATRENTRTHIIWRRNCDARARENSHRYRAKILSHTHFKDWMRVLGQLMGLARLGVAKHRQASERAERKSTGGRVGGIGR